MAGTEAAATDPLLHEPDCPVGFKPDGTDSENAAMFKSIIVAPAGDGLEAKLKVRCVALASSARQLPLDGARILPPGASVERFSHTVAQSVGG